MLRKLIPWFAWFDGDQFPFLQFKFTARGKFYFISCSAAIDLELILGTYFRFEAIVFVLNYNLVDLLLTEKWNSHSPSPSFQSPVIFCHEQPFIKPGGGVNRRLISFRESWKIKCMMCRFTVSPGSATCARHQSIAAKPYERLSTCLLLNQYFQRRLFLLMLHLWLSLWGVNARKGNKVFTPRKHSLSKMFMFGPWRYTKGFPSAAKGSLYWEKF